MSLSSSLAARPCSALQLSSEFETQKALQLQTTVVLGFAAEDLQLSDGVQGSGARIQELKQSNDLQVQHNAKVAKIAS